MKTDNIDVYRSIEYRYLELLRDCVLSKQFSTIFLKFNDSILFRRNIYRVEEPTNKSDVLAYLSEFCITTRNIEYQCIKYLVDEDCYALYLMLDGVVYSIRIEVEDNLISTLWINEKWDATFPEKPSEILNAIAKNWENQYWMYIENFLDRNFRFEMYGTQEIFGYHVLSKRQFMVWITSRFRRLKLMKYMPDFEFQVKAKSNGIIITINGQSRFILMKIINGKIVKAKEIDTFFIDEKL